jgi:hypothetical protein
MIDTEITPFDHFTASQTSVHVFLINSGCQNIRMQTTTSRSLHSTWAIVVALQTTSVSRPYSPLEDEDAVPSSKIIVRQNLRMSRDPTEFSTSTHAKMPKEKAAQIECGFKITIGP